MLMWGERWGYAYHQAEERRRNKINLIIGVQVRVYCPQVHDVERILLTKYILIPAIPPKDTNCAAFDYVGPLLL